METIHLLNRALLWLFAFASMLRMLSFTHPDRLGWLRFVGLGCLYAGLLLIPYQAWLSWDGHDWIEDGDDLCRIGMGIIMALALGYTWISRQGESLA
jgi:hypothetical protein